MTQQAERSYSNARPTGPQTPSTYENQDGRDGKGADEDNGAGMGAEVLEKAREQMSAVKDQASDRIEDGRERVADGAQQAADRVREEAESRGGVQGKVGLKAADTMEQAAGYLRDHRTDEIWSDVERYAKEHPMQAVGGAVFAGFLLGRVLR